MQLQLVPWGNSTGIRIPKTILKEAGLQERDNVSVVVIDGSIVIKRVTEKPKYHLEDLIAGITDENKHPAIW